MVDRWRREARGWQQPDGESSLALEEGASPVRKQGGPGIHL